MTCCLVCEYQTYSGGKWQLLKAFSLWHHYQWRDMAFKDLFCFVFGASRQHSQSRENINFPEDEVVGGLEGGGEEPGRSTSPGKCHQWSASVVPCVSLVLNINAGLLQVPPLLYPEHLHLWPSHPKVPLPPPAKPLPLEMKTSLSVSPSPSRLQAHSQHVYISSSVYTRQNKYVFFCLLFCFFKQKLHESQQTKKTENII